MSDTDHNLESNNILFNVNESYSPSQWEGDPNPNWCYSMGSPAPYTDGKGVKHHAWKIGFTGTGGDWGTVCWAPNHGAKTIPGDATAIAIWVVGAAGGEVVHFGYPGVKIKETLTKDWQQILLPLPHGYTPNTANPFLWACGAADNPHPITFYLGSGENDITYVKPGPSKATKAYAANLFHLLGYKVANVAPFSATAEGMPLGPVKPDIHSDKAEYSKVFNVPGYIPAPEQPDEFSATPPTDYNPYREIGSSITLSFDLQDVFGNKYQPSDLSNVPPIALKYYDPLIAPATWPHIALSYEFTASAINLYGEFNISAFIPNARQSLATCLKRAAMTLQQLTTIYYQLKGDAQLSVSTTLGKSVTAPAIENLANFIGDCYGFCSALYALSQGSPASWDWEPVPLTSPYQLATLSSDYYISIADLALANENVANIFDASTEVNIPYYFTSPYNSSLDSLCSDISTAYGLQVKASDILSHNQNRPVLNVGTAITIENSHISATPYTIKENDTLAGILQQFHSDQLNISDLARENSGVKNLFQDQAHLLVYLESQTGSDLNAPASLNTIAAGCKGGVSVTELAEANLDTPLNASAVITLANAMSLNPGHDQLTAMGTILSTTSSNSNDSISLFVSSPEDTANFFAANANLLDILDSSFNGSISVIFNDNAHSIPLAVRRNETLLSLYRQAIDGMAAIALSLAEPAKVIPVALQFSARTVMLSVLPNASQGQLAEHIQNLICSGEFAVKIAAEAVFAKSVILFTPPKGYSAQAAYTPNHPGTIQALHVSLGIERHAHVIHGAPAEVSAISSKLSPHMTSPSGDSHVDLVNFALAFEKAFLHLKLGAGRDPQGGTDADSLWVVPLPSRLSYTPAQHAPYYFAPSPLATQLLARKNVPIRDYQSGQSLASAKATLHNLSRINLDQWGRRCLESLDWFLGPELAPVAFRCNPEDYQTIIRAKQTIAEAIANNAEPLFKYDASHWSTQLDDARDVLRQQILGALSTAYEVDVIVQHALTTTGPTQTDSALPPLLQGQPCAGTYQVPTSHNNLNTLLKAFETPTNPSISLNLLGTVLTDVPDLFTGSISIAPKGQYSITSSDTLSSIAKHFDLGIAVLLGHLAGEDLLIPGKVIPLAWISIQCQSHQSLEDLARFFECNTRDIVQANWRNQSIIGSGVTITIDTHSPVQNYTTGDSDSFHTIYKALRLEEDEPVPSELSDLPGLFKSQAAIGLLSLQDGGQFSPASVAFNNGSSYLSYLFESTQSAGADSLQEVNRRFYAMSFQGNQLAHQRQALQQLPGYDQAKWLNFILPLKPRSLGTVDIPLLVREFPAAPIPVSQSEVLEAPGSPLTLQEITAWTYAMTYKQQTSAQDETLVQVAFNVFNEADAPDSSRPQAASSNAGGDLLDALAQFNHICQQLEQDLASLAQLEGPFATATHQQKTALETYASCIEQVADAWQQWREDKVKQDSGSLAHFQCKLSHYMDAGELTIVVERVQGSLPGKYALPLVVVDPEYWQASADNQPPPSDQDIDRVTYKFQAIGSPGQAEDHAEIRTLLFQGLNIIHSQNAWGALCVQRNQNLIPGLQTAGNFIYQTPWVRFVNKLTPSLSWSQPIQMQRIVSTHTTTLEQTLSTFFKELFSLGDPAGFSQVYRFKLVGYFSHTLGSHQSQHLRVKSPITFHPKVEFNMQDWQTGSMPSPSFTQQLMTVLQDWQTQEQLSHSDLAAGEFTFELTLYSSESEVPKLLNFLATNNTSNLSEALSRTNMPLSYYIPDNYWTTAPNNQKNPFTVDAYAERALAHYGADIYDVATMVIAFSTRPDFDLGISVSRGWVKRLLSSSSGRLQSIRGWSKTSPTHPKPFEYGINKKPFKEANGDNAAAGPYFFRMISDQYYLIDPLTKSTLYPGKARPKKLNDTPIKWMDWKPITGENAWGAILGPLQLEYRLSGGKPSFRSDAIQLALKVLPAYKAMQFTYPLGDHSTQRGALFYAPKNTAANTRGEVNYLGVSNENNFSSYAALTVLMEMLSAAAAHENDQATLAKISQTFDSVKTIAMGIKDYFKKHLINHASPGEKCFFTGGTYSSNTGDFSGGTDDDGYPFAVDVHTWGASVLGVENIDGWFGLGTCYEIWQTVKNRAGYFEGGATTNPILGVGYTDVSSLANNKPPVPEDKWHKYIISAEWSFGAVTMCRVIAKQYRAVAAKSYGKTRKELLSHAFDMEADAESMTNGVRNLLLDTSRKEQNIYAYYYANRRYDIPFGWYANRVDSLCSSSWGVMVAQHFNPFMLGGSYDKTVIDPDTYTLSSWAPQTYQPIAAFSPNTALSKAGIPGNQQGLVWFLVSNNTRNLSQPAGTQATAMPLSFYAAPDYWNSLPKSYEANTVDAYAERALVHYGVDIYDAATMQCALSIFPDCASAMETAKGQTKRLLASFSIPNKTMPGKDPSRPPNSTIRGWTNVQQPSGKKFYYGKNKTPFFPNQGDNTSAGAYFYRSISDQCKLQDPLTGNTSNPDGSPLVWMDWKPITGENAWAAFIGPLQVAYTQYGGIPPLACEAVQLALKVLPAYQAMQADNGAIFYAPWNMAANDGGTADYFSISNENNFSSFAGLCMLQEVLSAGGDQTNLAIVKDLLGGIESYFFNDIYDPTSHTIYTGGTYSKVDKNKDPILKNGEYQYTDTFTPGGPSFKFAVDVHTWGCTVLGVERVDAWFGEGTAYNLWQTVKNKAGYFEDGDTSKAILGVGYTDVSSLANLIPPVPPQDWHRYIISAEWSFGAVNMCRALAATYNDPDSTFYKPEYAVSLLEDAESMIAGVKRLLLNTSNSNNSYSNAYYYANRRYKIPFGWYANKIDSLCSTAWGVMVANNFNPFTLGGGIPKRHSSQDRPRPILDFANLSYKN